MIVQHIDFELTADNTQTIKTSELKKILKVMKVYNEQWLHFNLLDIIIGNNRNIVIKNDYNGANFANFALNTNDIELLLTIAKTEELKVLFFAKNDNSIYLAVKGNGYVKIK